MHFAPAMPPKEPQKLGLALAVLAIAVFLIPTAIAPLTYPGVYEDEPWVFLPMLEATRGNGFSFAAIGEGQTPSLVFALLTAPFLWASPLDANLTIRLLSALACVTLLVATYVIARRLSPNASFVAPVALVAIPLVYLTLRYGRLEAFALALGFWAIACALSGRFWSAGVLSALAVSVHPIMVWVGLPCLIAALAQERTAFFRYTAAGIVGLAPQALWTLFLAPPLDKHMGSSSVGEDRFEVLLSLAREPDRYVAYMQTLSPTSLALHVVLLTLAMVGIVLSRGATRWIVAAIALAPFIALALLNLVKNPYYFVGALPGLSIAAAVGAAKAPRLAASTLGAAVLLWVAVTHTPEAWRSRENPTVATANTELANQLPHGAVVFSPLREAGIIHARPDLRFYSYHSLAPAESWDMPACETLNERIREIVASDRRKTSATGEISEHAYLVMLGMSWPNYLASIYGPEAPERLACLWGDPSIEARTTQVCGPARCEELDVRRRPLE